MGWDGGAGVGEEEEEEEEEDEEKEEDVEGWEEVDVEAPNDPEPPIPTPPISTMSLLGLGRSRIPPNSCMNPSVIVFFSVFSCFFLRLLLFCVGSGSVHSPRPHFFWVMARFGGRHGARRKKKQQNR